jgi:hypothetical protein
MSVAVCIHKCIGNGYIHTVTCTFTKAVYVDVKIFSWNTNDFTYERVFNNAFSYGEYKEDERAQWRNKRQITNNDKFTFY